MKWTPMRKILLCKCATEDARAIVDEIEADLSEGDQVHAEPCDDDETHVLLWIARPDTRAVA